MSQQIRIGHELSIPLTKNGTKAGPPVCGKCGKSEEELRQPCVSLVHATPEGDKLIAYMARVSNPKATPDMDSAKLIGFLLRNHHWSPFEMANMAIEVNTTRDITVQIIRHRSMAFQEFSTRYADVEELEDHKECRFQDDKNRQNSFEASEQDQANVYWWNGTVALMASRAESAYREARKRGIAKEVARSILPMGLVPSKIYINGTVRSWLHYIAERTKPGVQKEHRELALAAELILAKAYPAVYAAYTTSQLKEG